MTCNSVNIHNTSNMYMVFWVLFIVNLLTHLTNNKNIINPSIAEAPGL